MTQQWKRGDIIQCDIFTFIIKMNSNIYPRFFVTLMKYSKLVSMIFILCTIAMLIMEIRFRCHRTATQQ